jgi:DNA-binding response OmpR family regulator
MSSLARAPRPARRVLVVEDNADALDLLAKALHDFGFDPWPCPDASSAVQAMDRVVSLDAALIDVWLPGMHGNDLAQCIRSRFPDARIVFVTGDSSVASELSASGEKVLPKPFSVFELKALLHAMFAASAQR